MANCALVLLLAWKNQLLQFQELALDQFKWTSWIIYEISVMAEREGLSDQFAPIRRFPRKNKASRRVTDYSIDYIVDYCSSERRRIALPFVGVNPLGRVVWQTLIQG